MVQESNLALAGYKPACDDRPHPPSLFGPLVRPGPPAPRLTIHGMLGAICEDAALINFVYGSITQKQNLKMKIL